MTIESFGLVAWYTLPSFRAALSPSAVAVDFCIACVTGFVIDINSKRPYSFLPAFFFLFIGSLSRLAKCESYFRAHGLYFATGIMFAGFCCKLGMLFLLLLPRKLPSPTVLGKMSPYLSWYEELIALSHSAFFGLFRNFPDKESAPKLDLELDPNQLAETFSKSWDTVSLSSGNPLLTVCLKTVAWFLFLGVFPRLAASASLLAQPILLRRIILFVGSATPDLETQWTLVFSTFAIFFSYAIFRSCHHLLNHRMHVALRGALLFHVFQKIHRLGPKQAELSTTTRLINNDIPTICKHIQLYYQGFNDAIYIGLGFLLMWVLAGPACLISVASVMISVAFRHLLRGSISRAESDLTNKSRKRQESIESALSQLPLIKMMGLRSVVVDRIFTLRQIELESLRTSLDIDCLTMLADITVDTISPSLICMGFCLLTPDKVLPEHVFPSLALSVHLQIALYTGMRRYGMMDQFFEALKRVEDFLLQDELVDTRAVTDLGTTAVRCAGLAIAPEGCEEPVLRNVNFSVPKSSITTCIGPSSSGKSTFLQGLAGEARLVEGSMQVDNPKVAYCDQDPWLENVSIRENIISGLVFDPVRYETILRVCLLHHDIQKLEEGDAYITGVNGANLSNGQRYRIVSSTFLFHHYPHRLIGNYSA